jgi:hypothetical protein
MKHRLSPIGPLVDDQAIAVDGDTLLPGYLRGHGDQMSGDLLMRAVHIGGTDDMLAGHDQDMYGCLRVYITEGDRVFVLIHKVAGPLPRDDLAENAVHSFPLYPGSSRRWSGFRAESVPGDGCQTHGRDRIGEHGG